MREAAGLEPDCVVGSNVLTTYRLRWEEIERFRVQEVGRLRLAVRLRDGRSIGAQRMTGSDPRLVPGNMIVRNAVDELNALLSEPVPPASAP